MSGDTAPQKFSQSITPVRSGNVFEETVEKIIVYITAGLSLPGDKLPSERELCDLLGVSRATIHDVIKELENLGYIEIKRGRYGGAYILTNSRMARNRKKFCARDAYEIADLMEYRAILESAAAKYATHKLLAPEERKKLTQALTEVENSTDENYRILDSRFHLVIAQVAEIPRLTQQLVTIRSEVNELLDQFPLLQNNIRHADSQHRALIDAILRGNAEEASRIAEEHVQGTAALIRALVPK